MQLFVAVANIFQPLTIVKSSSFLDEAGVLDPTLITDILAQ